MKGKDASFRYAAGISYHKRLQSRRLDFGLGKQFQPQDTLHKQVCAYLHALTNASDPAHVHIGIAFSDVIIVNAVGASGLMGRALSLCVCAPLICMPLWHSPLATSNPVLLTSDPPRNARESREPPHTNDLKSTDA